MLRSVFPRAHQKYFSLPLLGPITDGFDDWLAASGFTLGSRTLAINLLPIADKQLRRRGIDEVAKLNHAVLDDCCKALKKRYPYRAGTIHTLERYLVANGLIVDGRQAATQPSSLTGKYAGHLREVRGFATSTVSSHRRTAQCFLQHLAAAGTALRRIRPCHIESYVAQAGKRLSRASLQHDIAARVASSAFSQQMVGLPPGWIGRSTRRESTAWSDSLAPYRGKQFAHCCNPWTRHRPWGCATTRCSC